MHYILTLTLDAEKPGAPVEISISGEIGGPPAALGEGAFLLQRGDTLRPRVVLSAPAADRTQVKLSSLMLAAAPRGEPAPKHLSPFNKYDACVSFGEWGLPAVASIRGVDDVQTIDTLAPATVTAKKGAWTLAGYISLLIARAGKKTRPRCYRFTLDVDAQS